MQETNLVIDVAHSAFIFAKRQGMAQEHVAEAQTIEIDALRQLGDMLKATELAYPMSDIIC